LQGSSLQCGWLQTTNSPLAHVPGEKGFKNVRQMTATSENSTKTLPVDSLNILHNSKNIMFCTLKHLPLESQDIN
jgi:hypothetical protein